MTGKKVLENKCQEEEKNILHLYVHKVCWFFFYFIFCLCEYFFSLVFIYFDFSYTCMYTEKLQQQNKKQTTTRFIRCFWYFASFIFISFMSYLNHHISLSASIFYPSFESLTYITAQMWSISCFSNVCYSCVFDKNKVLELNKAIWICFAW